ncbi:TonB-dependent hemoglobin/transferrin/lactoferrin family receptor [Luteimonas sp. Y-2-2-4F]|nr:TonB-dependent receptor [Luteimonas sp. Y-2-2-4F]MCD9030777.1 TonB-dependent hemoglobin/transferrin/lactoferrin family receptor [Luteimonas sp. Y-2-2-4F]
MTPSRLPSPCRPSRARPGSLLAAGIALVLCAGPAMAQAPAPTQAAAVPAREFDIPAQPLDAALTRLADQGELRILFASADAAGVRSRALSGRYTAEEALSRLLAGTPLAWRWQEPGIAVVEKRPADGIVLGTLQVEGRRLQGAGGGAPAAEAIYEAPRALSVVTREDMDRIPVRHAAELIEATPGVASAVNRLDPALSINIRGMQDFGRVNMMIDGMRQNFVRNGHQQRNGQMYIDAELLSGVTIERGPRNDVHGMSAIAGQVNFHTLDFADLIRDDGGYGLRLRGNGGLGGEGNGVDFIGSAAGAAKLGERWRVLAARSRRSIGDYDVGRRGDAGWWGDALLTDLEDYEALTGLQTIRFASQKQDSDLFKARFDVGDGQWLQFTYIGTGLDYANLSEQRASALDLAVGESPWRRSGDARVDTESYALDWRWAPPGSDWIDLRAKIYTVDTRNRNRTEPRYPATLFGFTNAQYEAMGLGEDYIGTYIDGLWDRGQCEGDSIAGSIATACTYGIGLNQRIRTETRGLQLDNTSRFDVGDSALLTANYGLEYFRDEAGSTITRDHEGRTIEHYNQYGQGESLNPEGKRAMASAFANLTLEDDFYTVSAGLRYDRYSLEGDTQVPGTRSVYRTRYDQYLAYMCTRSGDYFVERCGNAREFGEPWVIDNQPNYYTSGNFSPRWVDSTGLYDYRVDRSQGKWLPALAAAIRPTRWLELYANWGRSWRPPAINETLMAGSHPGDNFAYMYSNPNLDPETSRTWEMGANLAFEGVFAQGDALFLKLGYFDTRADDYVITTLNNNTPGTGTNALFGLGKTAFVNNRAPTRFRGIELEGRYDAGPVYAQFSYIRYVGGDNRFCQDLYFAGAGDSKYDRPDENGVYPEPHRMAVEAGYDSWQAWADDQVVCDDTVGVFNSIAGRPLDKGHLVLGTRLFDRRLDTGLRLTYSGSGGFLGNAYGAAYRDVDVWHSYTLLDWYASFRVNANLKLFASVENLRDRNYVDTGADHLAWVAAPGRTTQVGFEWSF